MTRNDGSNGNSGNSNYSSSSQGGLTPGVQYRSKAQQLAEQDDWGLEFELEMIADHEGKTVEEVKDELEDHPLYEGRIVRELGEGDMLEFVEEDDSLYQGNAEPLTANDLVVGESAYETSISSGTGYKFDRDWDGSANNEEKNVVEYDAGFARSQNAYYAQILGEDNNWGYEIPVEIVEEVPTEPVMEEYTLADLQVDEPSEQTGSAALLDAFLDSEFEQNQGASYASSAVQSAELSTRSESTAMVRYGAKPASSPKAIGSEGTVTRVVNGKNKKFTVNQERDLQGTFANLGMELPVETHKEHKGPFPGIEEPKVEYETAQASAGSQVASGTQVGLPLPLAELVAKEAPTTKEGSLSSGTSEEPGDQWDAFFDGFQRGEAKPQEVVSTYSLTKDPTTGRLVPTHILEEVEYELIEIADDSEGLMPINTGEITAPYSAADVLAHGAGAQLSEVEQMVANGVAVEDLPLPPMVPAVASVSAPESTYNPQVDDLDTDITEPALPTPIQGDQADALANIKDYFASSLEGFDPTNMQHVNGAISSLSREVAAMEGKEEAHVSLADMLSALQGVDSQIYETKASLATGLSLARQVDNTASYGSTGQGAGETTQPHDIQTLVEDYSGLDDDWFQGDDEQDLRALQEGMEQIYTEQDSVEQGVGSIYDLMARKNAIEEKALGLEAEAQYDPNLAKRIEVAKREGVSLYDLASQILEEQENSRSDYELGREFSDDWNAALGGNYQPSIDEPAEQEVADGKADWRYLADGAPLTLGDKLKDIGDQVWSGVKTGAVVAGGLFVGAAAVTAYLASSIVPATSTVTQEEIQDALKNGPAPREYQVENKRAAPRATVPARKAPQAVAKGAGSTSTGAGAAGGSPLPRPKAAGGSGPDPKQPTASDPLPIPGGKSVTTPLPQVQPKPEGRKVSVPGTSGFKGVRIASLMQGQKDPTTAPTLPAPQKKKRAKKKASKTSSGVVDLGGGLTIEPIPEVRVPVSPPTGDLLIDQFNKNTQTFQNNPDTWPGSQNPQRNMTKDDAQDLANQATQGAPGPSSAKKSKTPEQLMMERYAKNPAGSDAPPGFDVDAAKKKIEQSIKQRNQQRWFNNS